MGVFLHEQIDAAMVSFPNMPAELAAHVILGMGNIGMLQRAMLA